MHKSKDGILKDKLKLRVTFLDVGYSNKSKCTIFPSSRIFLGMVHGIVLAYDVTDVASFVNLFFCHLPKLSKEVSSSVKFLVLGNKIDCERNVSREVRKI